jgi:hypothetical protein
MLRRRACPAALAEGGAGHLTEAVIGGLAVLTWGPSTIDLHDAVQRYDLLIYRKIYFRPYFRPGSFLLIHGTADLLQDATCISGAQKCSVRLLRSRSGCMSSVNGMAIAAEDPSPGVQLCSFSGIYRTTKCIWKTMRSTAQIENLLTGKIS